MGNYRLVLGPTTTLATSTAKLHLIKTTRRKIFSSYDRLILILHPSIYIYGNVEKLVGHVLPQGAAASQATGVCLAPIYK